MANDQFTTTTTITEPGDIGDTIIEMTVSPIDLGHIPDHYLEGDMGTTRRIVHHFKARNGKYISIIEKYVNYD